MKWLLFASLVALTGCQSATGVAEFAPATGPQLDRAKAFCRMRANNRATALTVAGTNPFDVPYYVVDDGYNCFAAQGVKLKGYRQANGILSRYPTYGTGFLDRQRMPE